MLCRSPGRAHPTACYRCRKSTHVAQVQNRRCKSLRRKGVRDVTFGLKIRVSTVQLCPRALSSDPWKHAVCPCFSGVFCVPRKVAGRPATVGPGWRGRRSGERWNPEPPPVPLGRPLAGGTIFPGMCHQPTAKPPQRQSVGGSARPRQSATRAGRLGVVVGQKNTVRAKPARNHTGSLATTRRPPPARVARC